MRVAIVRPMVPKRASVLPQSWSSAAATASSRSAAFTSPMARAALRATSIDSTRSALGIRAHTSYSFARNASATHARSAPPTRRGTSEPKKRATRCTTRCRARVTTRSCCSGPGGDSTRRPNAVGRARPWCTPGSSRRSRARGVLEPRECPHRGRACAWHTNGAVRAD